MKSWLRVIQKSSGGRDCSELPSFIIKRLPVRFTYDNNYFNDLYQGIPIGGYNVLTERLFEKADVQTGVDFLEDKEKYLAMGETVIYTGAIDAFLRLCTWQAGIPYGAL